MLSLQQCAKKLVGKAFHANHLWGAALLFSSSPGKPDLVLTDLEVETGIATITLNRAPANSLSLEMNQAISNAIKNAEANPKIQAMVLCSSLETIFCAGLDLTELYKPDADRLPKFWESFQQVYIDLYGSRLATVAAMAGHAPAAGCMLALSCDYRVMSGGSIGLNESKLGIVAPPWLAKQYIDTIGHRRAELALSLGTLYNHKEALAVGLVDDVVQRANIVAHAKKQAAEWARIPPPARVAVKQLTRKAQIDNLLATREADTEHFCSFVTNDKAQRNLGAYLESMKKKK